MYFHWRIDIRFSVKPRSCFHRRFLFIHYFLSDIFAVDFKSNQSHAYSDFMVISRRFDRKFEMLCSGPFKSSRVNYGDM